MWLFLEKIQMFACSNNVCACRKLSTFRYLVLLCRWFLIFDINCGVCWKDKFLFKTVLNIVDSSILCSRTGTFLYLGLEIQWNVCLPDFMFLGQTLNSAVVSTFNILYEANFEIKKNEMKLPLISWMILVLECSLHCSEACSNIKDVAESSRKTLVSRPWGQIILSNYLSFV